MVFVMVFGGFVCVGLYCGAGCGDVQVFLFV